MSYDNNRDCYQKDDNPFTKAQLLREGSPWFLIDQVLKDLGIDVLTAQSYLYFFEIFVSTRLKLFNKVLFISIYSATHLRFKAMRKSIDPQAIVKEGMIKELINFSAFKGKLNIFSTIKHMKSVSAVKILESLPQIV